MLPEKWQAFIEEQGGRFNAANEAEFADAAKSSVEQSAFMADLSYLGLIEVSGEDRITFLQGQLTNDLQQIGAEHSHFSGYCTPKGRMLALFRVIPQEDKLLLLFPQELLVPIAKRLQMYVLMSKVTIEDKSTDLTRIGIGGESILEALKEKYQLPDSTNQVTHDNNITWVKLADSTPRYIALGDSESISQLWKTAHNEVQAQVIDSKNWKLKDIQAGLPQVYGSTAEAFIPQMQNLQALDGVNFKKGCYTGQEVIARMQYLGKLKRQMYLLKTDSNTLPQPGDALFSPSSSSGQGAGKVVDAQLDPLTQKINLLAVLEISSAESQTLFLDEANQTSCEILPLPYSIESE